MFSIFVVLSLLMDVSFGQGELGYNDLQDPAEWTQPGEEEYSDDPLFTTQDFTRHSPEMLKLRQDYVQALWEQILQLQKDFPSDDQMSENTMPWLWQALRDKFNQGGLPNFDFDTVLPRLTGQVSSNVNMKSVVEILQDMYHQSMNPGADFYEDMDRNLYLFNVYYDNRRKFLEEEAGRLLKHLYIQNKGCFTNAAQLARSFEEPFREAYEDYSFTPEEMHTLMFNIKHIFEGFNELKGNLEVLDVIGRRILRKLRNRLEDPRKENLYHSIVKLFNKYGPAFNDPRNMEGSWPRLVVDLLAAVCQKPTDLVNFIQNLVGLFDNNPAAFMSSNNESDKPNEVTEGHQEASEPQTISKRNVPAKIRRKAPQLGFEKQFQQASSSKQEMVQKAQKGSSSESSSDVKNHYFGPLKAFQAKQHEAKSLDESAFDKLEKSQKMSSASEESAVGNPSGNSGITAAQSKMAAQASQSGGKLIKQSKTSRSEESSVIGSKGGEGPIAALQKSQTKQSSSESGAGVFQKTEKKSTISSTAVKQGLPDKLAAGVAEQFAKESSDSASQMFKKGHKKSSSSSSVGLMGGFPTVLNGNNNFLEEASQSAADMYKKFQPLSKKSPELFSDISGMSSELGNLMKKIEDDTDKNEGNKKVGLSVKFMSTAGVPGAHMKGFKRRFGNEESSSNSKLKRKGRRKTSKQTDRIAAYKRQLDALQQLQTARAQLLGRKSSSAGYHQNLAVGPAAGPGPEPSSVARLEPGVSSMIEPSVNRLPPRGLAAQSSGFQAETSMIAAERAKAHQLIANRERLQALQAERTAETTSEDEDVEKNTKKSTNKNTGEEEGYEKEYEDKHSPYGSSRGKIKAYKKSSSSESSESTSSFKRKVSKKGAKVNEKIATLDKEIEELQEMLASKEKVVANNAAVRAQDSQLSTMSAEMGMASTDAVVYQKYRMLLAQKLKQRAKLVELKKQIDSESEEVEPFSNMAVPQNGYVLNSGFPPDPKAFRSAHAPFAPHSLRPYAHPVTRREKTFSGPYVLDFQPSSINRLYYQGAPLLGLGPYTVPQQGSEIQNTQKERNNYFMGGNQSPVLAGRRNLQENPERTAGAVNAPNPYAKPLATFRSAGGSTKNYHRKYGSEQNESSSKKKIKQKNKKKKKAQKLAAARSLAESSAQQQSSQEKLAAKTAQNRQFENKAKGLLLGGGLGQSQEVLSKGAESKLAELEAYRSNLKQSKQQKALAESISAENNEEDEDSETEVEQSTSSKSAKNYGEESAYSTEYNNLATFHSAKSGPPGRSVGYRRQFGSEDNKATALKRIGDQVRGGEVSRHVDGYTGQVIGPGLFQRIPQQAIRPLYNRMPLQSSSAFVPEVMPPFAYEQPGAPSMYLPPTSFTSRPTENEAAYEDVPASPSVVGAVGGGGFVQQGGYQRQLPDNGQETGFQNKYGQFGTFHSAFSAPGKSGTVKGYKKKYGSESAEESSNVKKKQRNKSSKKGSLLNAVRADASSKADVKTSHENLLQQQAKNAEFQNKLNTQGNVPGGVTGAVQAELSEAKGEKSMLAASKDEQNIRLQQQANAAAFQAQQNSEEDESEIEIEENTSKKSAKNYGEESAYESSNGDIAQFQSPRSKSGRSYRGFKEDSVYLDDLVNFRNARQPKPAPLLPVPVSPNLPQHYAFPPYIMGPNVEMSGYRKKYGSESEERSSKMRQNERHRTATQLAKMAAVRGQMESLNEVEQDTEENTGLNAGVTAYRNKPVVPGAENAGVRARYDMFADRRDALKARHQQRAKLYSLEKEALLQTTESEKELEKSTHEKKEKEGGEEAGYHHKFTPPSGAEAYTGLRGQAKGFNKNFSKESSEKSSNYREKARQKTALLIAKITEVQRELDMLSELQATRHQRIAATGELAAYTNRLGQNVNSQQTLSAEMKQIVKEKSRLRLQMTELQQQLAVHQSESQKELEHELSEQSSKDTGEESSYEQEFGSGNAADGNVVSGSSSGYSKMSSSQSSKRTQYGHMKGFDQSNNAALNTEAFKAQDEIQNELERESDQRFKQMGELDMNSGVPNFGAIGQPGAAFGQVQPVQFPSMTDNSFNQLGNFFVPIANFRSNQGQRLGKRGYKKFPGYPPLSIADNTHPFSTIFGNAPSFPQVGLDHMTNLHRKIFDQAIQPLGFDRGVIPNFPQSIFNRNISLPGFGRNEMPKFDQNFFGRPFQSPGFGKGNKANSGLFPDFPQFPTPGLGKGNNANSGLFPDFPQFPKPLAFGHPFPNITSGVKDFVKNQASLFGDKVRSMDMDGFLSGTHKEIDLDGGDIATDTVERGKLMGGTQEQLAVGDDDFFANNMKYAGHNIVSQSPSSASVNQELSSRSHGVSANAVGFSQRRVSSSSSVFTG